MRNIALFAAVVLLAGCTTFQAKPLNPSSTASAFEGRTLNNTGLRAFLEKNLRHPIFPWPPASWDLRMLTLTAFYYHPDLDVARAAWQVKEAGVITAGERPNPGAGFTPQYHANPRGLAPWTLSFFLDIPIETAGRRGYRIARAGHLSDAARMEIADTAWQVRSRLRKDLLSLYALVKREQILQEELELQRKIVRIFRERFATGEESQYALTSSVITMEKTALSLSSVRKDEIQARVSFAGSMGIPEEALKGVHISFGSMEKVDAGLYSAEVRREALLNRADLLAKLSEYQAIQADLRLEIARQYPDIHLGPAYTWDQGDNEWSLGAALILPLLNRNEGPIAEARARRKEKASEFIALQARIIEDTGRAFAGYKGSLKLLETADSLLARQGKIFRAAEERFRAGQTDLLAVTEARIELVSARLSRLDALVTAQESVGRLEDAVQKPLNRQDIFPETAISYQGAGTKK
jgi:cobalt-zinc-cadmium efflux system outer membrane protein